MKLYQKTFYTIMLVLILALFATPALAMTPAQEISPPNFLQEIINVGTILATLAGVSALISVLVNVLKYYNCIPDGSGGRVFALLNLLAFIGLSAARIFAPQYSLAYLDGIASQIATIALFATGYLFQLGSGQVAYGIVGKADIPILSHSTTSTNTEAYLAKWNNENFTPPPLEPDITPVG
jgi:hypothetical protein